MKLDLSGAIRRYAYTYSEGRAAHWLLLMAADRVDVLETNVKDLLRGRPDNAVAEYGLKAELERHGVRSRLGRHRADVKPLSLEVLLVAGTSIAIAVFARRRRGAVRADADGVRLTGRRRPPIASPSTSIGQARLSPLTSTPKAQ